MASLLESVDKRTRMVGQNRLELLLFKLDGEQVYGINVFKVKEVLQCPPLTLIPGRNPVVRGVASIRGGTLSIIDLQMAMRMPQQNDLEKRFIIIAEYNNSVQGFLVRSVERIINTNWEDMHPPPSGSGNDSYLTAVTEVSQKLVEIIDVEKVLAEVAPQNMNISEGLINDEVVKRIDKSKLRILIVDDSSVARKQIERCIASLGIEIVTKNDGKQALNYLRDLAKDNENICDVIPIVVSDIEMPEMDGYTLTTEIRADEKLKKLHVLLHTSLSGIFNKNMVEKVGADDFLAKFNPDELLKRAAGQISALLGEDIVIEHS
ncbi:MAG TPA: chemotaxis protein CheV [Pseudomonadales bacterium]|nr:chemotaxis protein CheV [Pseudomonadales bacterium]